MKFPRKLNFIFIGTVILPTLIATIYYGLLASDIFVSESRYVVRSQEKQSFSPLIGSILEGAGFSNSQDDSYSVKDFILSRDALKTLDDEFQIKEKYSDSSIDIISRFAGLDWDESYENFHRYYQKIVIAQFDSVSSITTLKTRAFDADLARKINIKLLDLAEDLVNRLNERGRRDLIHFSLKEVAEAEKKAKEAALSLAHYRNEKGVIDPERQSTIPLQQVAKLQEELITTKAQIMQLEKLARDNPQLPVLKQRARLLEDEILQETLRIAGGEHSLAGKAAEYQRLVLEKEFADKMLASAMSSLEQARNEAQRQQLYLERIAQPSFPDSALEPRRTRSIIAVFALGLISWGILTMLITGIREHQD